MDPPPQRRAGRVAEELEESHEQAVLTLEDFNDEVLLKPGVKTNNDDGVDIKTAVSTPEKRFSLLLRAMRTATKITTYASISIAARTFVGVPSDASTAVQKTHKFSPLKG